MVPFPTPPPIVDLVGYLLKPKDEVLFTIGLLSFSFFAVVDVDDAVGANTYYRPIPVVVDDVDSKVYLLYYNAVDLSVMV